jgi:arylsulfatase A-like enzyme
MFGHFYPAMYEENTHVPMVAWDPNGQAANISEPFSLLDLPEYITGGGTDGNITDPPTREFAVMSDYDGRRDRNLVGMRGQNKKYLLETSSDAELGNHFTLEATADGKLERETEDGPENLQLATVRRNQHEEESLSLKDASMKLTNNGRI